MFKVGIVSEKKEKVEDVIGLLSGRYEVTERIDGFKDSLHSTVLKMEDERENQIALMFELIELAMGINPVGCKKKDKSSMKAKRAAWFILRNRFNMSYPKIADLMGCNHVTVMVGLRKLKKRLYLNNSLSIELVVSIVLRNL